MSQAKWICLGISSLALVLFATGMGIAFIAPDCAVDASFQCEIDHDKNLQSWTIGLWSVGGVALVAAAIMYFVALPERE